MDTNKHAITPLRNVNVNTSNIVFRTVNHVGYFKWIKTKDIQIRYSSVHQVSNYMHVQLPLIENIIM
jgi:hypothetical protein